MASYIYVRYSHLCCSLYVLQKASDGRQEQEGFQRTYRRLLAYIRPNIASSLKAMAIDFRWWLLSHTKRPLKEANLILHLDSLTEVIKLARTTPKLSFFCIMWLALNIVAELGLSILGLTFLVDLQSTLAITRNGTGQTPNLSQIYPELNSTAN